MGSQNFFVQKSGVYLIFCTEFWERFSYYGLLGILVFFVSDSPLHGGLGWTHAHALAMFGYLTGLIWFAPTIGGMIADRLIGPAAAVAIGCLTLGAANLTLAYAAHVGAAGVWAFWLAMGLMVCGAGFFKANASSLLSQLFPGKSSGRQAAFALFYMGINLGAAVAPIIVGTLAERKGWWMGFLISGIGMLFGLVIFLSFVGRSFPQSRPRIEMWNPDDPTKSKGGWIIIAMLPFAVIFACGLMQYGGLMNLYAQTDVDREILGWEIPATWFLTLNPLFILLLSGPTARFWAARDIGEGSRLFIWQVTSGLVLMSFAFASVALTNQFRGSSPAPVWTLPLFYLSLTAGELCVVPAGLAEISRVAPRSVRGTLMGLWILTLGIGGVIAGQIGAWAQTAGDTSAFTLEALLALSGALLLRALSAPISKLNVAHI